MNELKDQALRKALKQGERTPHLSPNFCFRTLQRIDELARLREKRAERRLLALITAVAVLLAGSGAFILVRYFGEDLRQAFDQLWKDGQSADYGVLFSFSLMIIILLGLDYIMRRTYYSHQAKRKKERGL